MKTLSLVFLTSTLLGFSNLPAVERTANWLEGNAPAVKAGISFGVPFKQGEWQRSDALAAKAGDGQTVPAQTWPLAVWPDGSVKWLGVAVSGGPALVGPLHLDKGVGLAPAVSLKASQDAGGVSIDTGVIQCRLAAQGAALIQTLKIAGREVARDGRLVAFTENRADFAVSGTVKEERFESEITKLTLEQAGPVRAVVKVEGLHREVRGGRGWLPFTVRLYFSAGVEAVRMVHTFIFDGDQEKDFIRGLGVRFTVPMREEIHNRHVRFSGEGSGLWSEPIQPAVGRQGRFAAKTDGSDIYPDQLAGKRVPNRDHLNARSGNLLEQWAVWDAFRLVQPNADGFTIEKRTNSQSAWIPAGAGKRASGLVFVGDVSGGLAMSLKNFWQSYPAALEVQNASTSAAEVTVWLWTPEAPGMDLRHYDIKAHGLEAVYEDVQPGFSTAMGVARTSELTLFPSATVPTKTETVAQASVGRAPPVLVCPPAVLHEARAFGLWSLPDRSTPFKKTIEDGLDETLAYYQKSVEQHHWYGFWDFGDFMHSYDADRHVWRYDLGGMAWDNSELGTDMWLWYSFLRSGRADIFRLAEAMTRHTGEVDCYHLGRFAGLGSRHNVRHWGCGAKEARISQAAYRRFYYYLTTDERVGDLMHEMTIADYAATEFDPMRLAQPATEAEKKIAPGRVRLGPDWLGFVGNWMTEWERTGDTKWRDKILAGVDSLSAMPLGMKNGKNLVFGYDPKSNHLFPLSEVAGDYNLATIMGGGEVAIELGEMLNDARWDKLWLQFCRLTTASADVIRLDMITGKEGDEDARYARPDRLAAYVYFKTKNPAFAKRALGGGGFGGGFRASGAPMRRIEGPDALNPLAESARVSTNGAAQAGLLAIEILELCADQLPTEAPAARRDEIESPSGSRPRRAPPAP
jgi:YetA-like protein